MCCAVTARRTAARDAARACTVHGVRAMYNNTYMCCWYTIAGPSPPLAPVLTLLLLLMYCTDSMVCMMTMMMTRTTPLT